MTNLFLLIDTIDPNGHTRVVSELNLEIIREYERGIIEIVDNVNLQVFRGTWEQPEWVPLNEEGGMDYYKKA